MIVSCSVNQCPYHDENGFCSKPSVISIDERGMCKVVWKNGNPADLSRFSEDKDYKKESVTIIE